MSKIIRAEEMVNKYFKHEVLGDSTVGVIFGRAIELDELVIVKCLQAYPHKMSTDFYLLVDVVKKMIYSEGLEDVVDISYDCMKEEDDAENELEEIRKEIFG